MNQHKILSDNRRRKKKNKKLHINTTQNTKTQNHTNIPSDLSLKKTTQETKQKTKKPKRQETLF